MKRKKIVYLIRKTAGGMQKYAVDLALALRNDYEVTFIFPPNQSLAAILTKEKIPFFQVDIEDKVSLFKDLKAVSNLKKIFNQIKPDILHIHGNKSAVVGRLAASSQIKKIIVTVHNPMKWQEARFLKNVLGSFIERYLAKKKTSKIITVSESLRKNLIDIENLPAEKIVAIPTYYMPNQGPEGSSLRKELGLKEGAKLLLNVARLAPDKDQVTLLQALSRLNENYKLAIAGIGPLELELQETAKELQLDSRVYFLGFRQDVSSLMEEADAFVLSSTNEGMPLTLFEAMAAKTVVVATRVDGIPEVIKDGQSGLLVPPKNPEALAKNIEKAVEDKKFRASLVQGAQDRLKHFSFEQMVSKIKDIYEA